MPDGTTHYGKILGVSSSSSSSGRSRGGAAAAAQQCAAVFHRWGWGADHMSCRRVGDWFVVEGAAPVCFSPHCSMQQQLNPLCCILHFCYTSLHPPAAQASRTSSSARVFHHWISCILPFPPPAQIPVLSLRMRELQLPTTAAADPRRKAHLPCPTLIPTHDPPHHSPCPQI